MNRRQFLYGSAAAFLAGAVPFHAFATEGPVVKTAKGSVRGLVMDGVHVFRGVPCGMPPYEGKYRLALPEFVPAWNGVVDAVKPGDIPLQPGGKGKILGGGDCLRLNIWTPAPGKTKCPVMVYIPGGGSTRCDNNDVRFDGTAFAQDGVVLVTINYRVNVDGFLKIKGVPSNLALRDMMFALRWVQDNIAAFGGDPDKVTVFGQSAGATHITSLISSGSRRAFSAAPFLQSPSAIAQYTSEQASVAAADLLAFYGIEDSREAVAALSPEKLLTFSAFASAKAKDPEWGRMLQGNVSVFKPYVDGDILMKRPVDAIADGAARDLDIMVGSAEQEWRYYTVPERSHRQDRRRRAQELRVYDGISRRHRGTLPQGRPRRDHRRSVHGPPVRPHLQDARQQGAGKPEEGRRQGLGLFLRLRSPCYNGRLGAAHSVDLPFVFKTLHKDSQRVKTPSATILRMRWQTPCIAPG